MDNSKKLEEINMKVNEVENNLINEIINNLEGCSQLSDDIDKELKYFNDKLEELLANLYKINK